MTRARLGYVAVWGLAIPSTEVLEQVAAGRAVLALDERPEIVERIAPQGPDRVRIGGVPLWANV
jgi:hypothetical protein